VSPYPSTKSKANPLRVKRRKRKLVCEKRRNRILEKSQIWIGFRKDRDPKERKEVEGVVKEII